MTNSRSKSSPELCTLIAAVNAGEPGAFDRLLEAIYPELKRLAHFQLGQERDGHTLNTTAVVHEAFIRLNGPQQEWSDRGHFLRAAATVMRHLLVDHARKRNAEKRGAGLAPITLDEARTPGDGGTLAVLALDCALQDIAEFDARLAQVVECRYFAGLSVAETAQAMGMSRRTVERDLGRARAYLREHLEGDG